MRSRSVFCHWSDLKWSCMSDETNNHILGRSTIASRPRLNDFYVVWGSAVHSCHACVHISYGSRCQNGSVDVSAPLYVVPKSTPTISLSCAGLVFSRVFTAGMGPWFALGSKATGMLPDLPLNALAMLCFLSIFGPIYNVYNRGTIQEWW